MYNTNMTAMRNYESSATVIGCRIVRFYMVINVLLNLYYILREMENCNMAIARNTGCDGNI
jgi:hypothetical protein